MNRLLKNAINKEIKELEDKLELSVDANYVSKEILKMQGSLLVNKNISGYLQKNNMAEYQDEDSIDSITAELACKLFKCKYANVWPHSVLSANQAVYQALLNSNDKVLGINSNNNNAILESYDYINYNLDSQTELIDYVALHQLAIKEGPRMIIVGDEGYSRIIDFKKIKEIAEEVKAYLVVDMSNIAGLVAAGIHPSPIPVADAVVTTTHKSLRGPRGGLILFNNEELAFKTKEKVFAKIHDESLIDIATKAQCFSEALENEFKEYQMQAVKNARTLAEALRNEKVRIVSNGTDNHHLIIDVKSTFNLTGDEAEKILEKININVNKNMIPSDKEECLKISGIKLGSLALTTRGLNEDDFKDIGLIIIKALKNNNEDNILNELKIRVNEITKKYPIYNK